MKLKRLVEDVFLTGHSAKDPRWEGNSSLSMRVATVEGLLESAALGKTAEKWIEQIPFNQMKMGQKTMDLWTVMSQM